MVNNSNNETITIIDKQIKKINSKQTKKDSLLFRIEMQGYTMPLEYSVKYSSPLNQYKSKYINYSNK